MADPAGLFTPDRVAVIGATDREGSVGRALLENLLADFEGDVVAVNPNREAVLGRPCLDRIGEAADPVDLAVVAVPAAAAIDVVREVGEAGIDHVVLVTAGFAETGGAGADRQAELADVVETYDLTLVGPNSLGVISTPVGLNATFAPTNARPGGISLVSQSGAFVTAVLDWAAARGVGFKDVVSLGNEVALDEVDFIEAWGEDPETAVIAGYVEDIERGRTFVETARRVTRETPIVLIKSGRTEAGARAASSHTGAIAGSERAYEAGLEQAGAIRAGGLQGLFDYAQALAAQPLPETAPVGIVTNAGGPGVMATDAVGASRLGMAALSAETVERLADVLPATAEPTNPVDVIGDADVDRVRTALDLVLSDDAVGAGLVVSAPTAVLEYDELAEAVGTVHAAHDKPVVACLMGGDRAARAAAVLDGFGVPNYVEPARAVDALAALDRYRTVRTRERATPTRFPVDRERAAAVIDEAAARPTGRVGSEGSALLEAYGIPTPAGSVATSPAAAERIARELGDRVVLKVVSEDVVHKTDVGGVRLGIAPDAVAAEYRALVDRVAAARPDASIDGVLVQTEVDTDDGVETIVGATRDPQFGPLVLFGLGGIFVAVFEDTTVRVAPVTEAEAREMVAGIDASALLQGARGREPVAVDGVVEVVQRVSQLVTDFPAVRELDVNPLLARPDGVTALDVRLRVDPDVA